MSIDSSLKGPAPYALDAHFQNVGLNATATAATTEILASDWGNGGVEGRLLHREDWLKSILSIVED